MDRGSDRSNFYAAMRAAVDPAQTTKPPINPKLKPGDPLEPGGGMIVQDPVRPVQTPRDRALAAMRRAAGGPVYGRYNAMMGQQAPQPQQIIAVPEFGGGPGPYPTLPYS